MWRAALALATLVLAVASIIAFGPDERRHVASATHAYPAPARSPAGSSCWKEVLRDWVDDARIEGTYPRTCYEFALNQVTGGDGGLTLYGAGDLLNALEAGIR